MPALPSTSSFPADPLLRLQCQNVWRASEMASYAAPVMSSGFACLDRELPNGGWPRSSLIELLLQQAGIGEMQLLKPALSTLSKRQRIVLVQPPYLPHAIACKTWNIDVSNLLWIRVNSGADALWTSEQILKNGSCGAVLLWQSNARNESLRRLNLAAQSTATWLWLMRPLLCRSDTSPAQLRIALRPAHAGVALEVLKRKGPRLDHSLFVPLADMPAARLFSETDYAGVAKRSSAPARARKPAALLV